jgi:hypothetical protein
MANNKQETIPLKDEGGAPGKPTVNMGGENPKKNSRLRSYKSRTSKTSIRISIIENAWNVLTS